MQESHKALIAEGIGTFALVFVGAGSVCLNEYTGHQLGLIGMALAQGLILATLVSAIFAISGGHLNPALTFGFWLTGRLSRNEALRYAGAQMAGAVVAAFLLRGVFSEHVWKGVSLGTPDLAGEVTTLSGIFIEAILTFLLAFVFWGTLVDERSPRMGGFPVGLTASAGILLAGPLTGAAMNPARQFGPALASAHWSDFLVYWIGPLLGGGAAAFLYGNFLLKRGHAGAL